MGTTEWEPGTVAVATINGETLRVSRFRDEGWILLTDPDYYWPDDGSTPVTDVRPLVVLDLDGYDTIHGPEALRFLADKADKGKGGNVFARIARDLADQIEAQTKPPRIPEPGLWGVVRDISGEIHVRETTDATHQWFAFKQQANVRWDDITNPTLIRDGVES